MIDLPPIVFLPGLCEPAAIWAQIRADMGLSADRTLCVDLPGHTPGWTPLDVARDLDSGRWLDDVAARIRARFDGEPAMLVGHSTGGMLAIALAQRHPDVARSLVLIGALTDGARDLTLGRLRHKMLNGRIGPAGCRAIWRLWLSSPLTFRAGFAASARRPITLPQAARMRAQLAACDPLAVLTCARGVLSNKVTQAAADLQAPILALVGARDPVVSAAQQLRVLRLARNAHAIVLDGGHLLFAEPPGRVSQALARWRALAPAPGDPLKSVA